MEIDDDVRYALAAGGTLAGLLILTGQERHTVSIRECKRDNEGDLNHGSLATYTRDFADLFVAHAVTDCALVEGNLEEWIVCCSRRCFPLARRIAWDDRLAEDAL